MKKLLFSLLALFFITAVAFSQEDPKKALGKATRALSAYNLNPTDNDGKLAEAKEMIEVALSSNEIAGQAKAWQAKGEIYNNYSDKDIAMMSFGEGQEYTPKYINEPYIAAEAFAKALSVAEKKYETKDALVGLNEAGRKLNQIGNYQINAQDYAGAYKTLNKVLEVNKLLAENEGEVVVQEADLKNQKFVVAYCASAAGNSKAASSLFKELYEAGSDEPTVYAQYANILLASGDKEQGVKVLTEGRKKFPDNSEILFALINYYIGVPAYDKLETILKEAIAAEPNNPSVRSALGNVYMNLYTEEFGKNGETETAKGYFTKSLDYFNQAVELEPKQFDAIYSIGSLYFNKAVEIVKKANDLPLEKAKEYDAMVKEANTLMDTALPYFQKSEAINPNDANTLIALGEIYARQNDFEKSKEFKSRLEVVKDGGTNKEAYHKN